MGKLHTVVFLIALVAVVSGLWVGKKKDFDTLLSDIVNEVKDELVEEFAKPCPHCLNDAPKKVAPEFTKPVEDEPVEDEPVEDTPVEDEPVEDTPVEIKVLTSSGDYCTFPFRYGKKKYSHCITRRHSSAWCATGKNYKKDHKWANCLLSGAVVTSVKGQLCHFPFTYKGKQYTACTTENSSNGWCSLTADYDKDKKYGYCYRTAKSIIVDQDTCPHPFSKEQCEAYATKGNHAFANVHSSQTEIFPAGCYLRYKTGTKEVVKAYFNKGSANSAPCGTHGRHCICNE